LKAYEFGPFRLEPAERQLRRDGTLLALTPKAFDTLLVLVDSARAPGRRARSCDSAARAGCRPDTRVGTELVGQAGRAVGKAELMEKVWRDTSVEDATLAQNIFALRKALGGTPQEQPDDPRGPRHIETVPQFGYRFVAPVREMSAAPQKIVMAVLPFENLSRDEDECFSDGLTEEMITQLGRLNPALLGVIARTSVMKYKSRFAFLLFISRRRNAALGQKDAAFRCLGEACAQSESWAGFLAVDPRIDVLRDDPRYLDLVQRLGLSA
jgi:DNA-binding winged helix-turn-helix (wHTH) protein